MIASIILALYLGAYIDPGEAATFLYVYGGLLIIAELAVVSYGLIAFNGLLALAVGYAIQTGSNQIFGLNIDWGFWFGVSFVEFLLVAAAIILIIRYRKIKTTTGAEAMVGQKARIINWNGKNGMVLADGENWKAVSNAAMELNKDDEVTVLAVEGLTLKIGP